MVIKGSFTAMQCQQQLKLWEIGPPPQASSMQPERACVKSSKQKLKQQAAACWSHCQQALARDHHHDSFPAAAKQTFYPPLVVAINLPPAVAVPPLDLTSIKRHCPCSNFVCKHSNALEKRAGTELPLSCQLLPSERIGAMFTNPARAGVLGAHVLGSFHPVYAENKISLDNACFPKGSHCCYVKLGKSILLSLRR